MLREIDKDLRFESVTEKAKWAILDFRDDPLGEPRKIRFKELSYYNSSVARKLLKEGYQELDRIAIIGLNSFKFVTAYFGARLAGMTPVLINHKLSPQQIEHVINHSEAKMVFHDDEFLELLPPSIKKVNFKDFDEWVEREDVVLKFNFDKQRPALMLYTSGTTGTPKGVLINTGNRQWAIRNSAPFPVIARTVLAQPMSHINGLNILEAILVNKSTLVLMPKFSVESYKHVVMSTTASRLIVVSPMMAMLLDDPQNVELMRESNVKLVRLTGAPTSEALYDRIADAFPNAMVRLSYGLSEVGPALFSEHETLPMPKMSVGVARPEIDYKIIDGVLHVKSKGGFKGYYKDEEKTKQSFTPDGFFNTKDKFRVDENGFYYFMGRADDMFVSGGENIFPGEVQETINKHPAVMDSYVLGLEDRIKGTKPYAFVVGRGVTEEELKDFYSKNGPAYQIPRRIWFLKEFPLTDNNKVDKKALLAMAQKLLEESETQ